MEQRYIEVIKDTKETGGIKDIKEEVSKDIKEEAIKVIKEIAVFKDIKEEVFKDIKVIKDTKVI
jgi:hypothetical protein